MARQLILGLGAGQCGLELLADILARQANAKITFQQPPLLPWDPPQSKSGIRERLDRITATTHAQFIGDVASFYLPYAAEAISHCPRIRMVCLRRPVDEIVAAFRAALNRNARAPINHWISRPNDAWEHDPYWSRIFPKYDLSDREEAIRRYCREYYSAAETLATRFPEQFRIIDTAELTTDTGVRETLSFCGFPWSDQVVITGRKPESRPTPNSGPPPRPYPNPTDPRRCAILVPFSGFIHQDCEQALKELERRGYQVRRVGGYAAIDQGRNQMATDVLLEGFEETLWIDSDVAFHPDDVEKLRSHNLPLVCGIYPQKGKRALACHIAPGTSAAVFGKDGGLVELLYAGTGFLLVRREVYLSVQRELNLPLCNERFGHPMIPFFLPMIRPIEEGHWYLAEDYAFCHRARECGYRIFADTSIRLWHIGTYRYGWEDAGMDRSRFASFTLNFNDAGSLPVMETTDPAVEELRQRYSWPEMKPEVPPPPPRNWLFPTTREMLAATIPRDAQLIVELGSFTGRSTRFLAEHAPSAVIIAVDHWRGSADMAEDKEVVEFLPRLYETFLSECWPYRDRIVPVRRESTEGLREIAEAGLRPSAVFIDADHSYDAVRADLETTLNLFPATHIVGDDWDWDGVRRAVEDVTRERGLGVDVRGIGWRILSSNNQERQPVDTRIMNDSPSGPQP